MADPREERERWRILERFLDANNTADQADAAWRAEQLKKLEVYVKAVEALPEALLAYCELKIYELRNERHLARKAGILTSPAPLLPLPPGAPSPDLRDQDHTGVFDRQHTDGRPRSVEEWIGGACMYVAKKSWTSGLIPGLLKVLLTAAGAAGAVHWLQAHHLMAVPPALP